MPKADPLSPAREILGEIPAAKLQSWLDWRCGLAMLWKFGTWREAPQPGKSSQLETGHKRDFMEGKKNSLVFIGFVSAALTLAATLAVFKMFPSHVGSQSAPPLPWNEAPIKATYVGSQLTEADKDHATLSLSYDLDNNADFDYRLANGSGVVILSRLQSDGSLNQQEAMRLGYPVFLPARQRARIAIEITEPFAWPTSDDPSYVDQLRDFVKQRLKAAGEFVVFDEEHHQQFTLPCAWEELQDVAQASN